MNFILRSLWLFATLSSSVSVPDVTSCRYYESRTEMDCNHSDLVELISNQYPVNISKLTSLQLRDAKLKTLKEDTFIGVPNLQYMDLGENALEKLHHHLFSQMKVLIWLNLSQNRLKFLDSKLFKNLVELKKLNLEYNKLTNLTNVFLFKAQSKLYYLNLKGNNIITITAEVLRPLISISRLDLSANPYVCDCELTLTILWTQQNCIDTGAMCQNPPKLNGLFWTELSKGNCEYPKERVSSLEINYSTVEQFSECKKKCYYDSKTHAIDCTEIKLGQVQADEYPLHNTELQSITLRKAELKELKPYTFQKFTELYSLDLGQNLLQHLDSHVFSGLSKLEQLYLDSNELLSINDGQLFSSLTNLELLDFSENHITEISVDVLNPLISLNSLKLENNPFNCNCDLLPAVNWCEARNIQTGAFCKTPMNYSSLPWTVVKNSTGCDLKNTTLKNPNVKITDVTNIDVTLIVVSASAALIVLSCLIIVIWMFFKRKRLADTAHSPTVIYDDAKSTDSYYETIPDFPREVRYSALPPNLPLRPLDLTPVNTSQNLTYDDVGNVIKEANAQSGEYVLPDT